MRPSFSLDGVRCAEDEVEVKLMARNYVGDFLALVLVLSEAGLVLVIFLEASPIEHD